MSFRTAVSCVLLLLMAATSFAETYDGRLFDPGVEMTAPAPSAPEALARMAGFVGEWDLELEIHRPGQEILRSTGVAKVTYANRGHCLMERTRIANFDGQGHGMASLGFIAVNASDVWTVGKGNSWTESIAVASGGFEDTKLVLYDAMRPGGGASLLQLRYTYAPQGDDDFEMTMETSNDEGGSWSTAVIQRYQRRVVSPDFFPVREDLGRPSPDRPEEAGQFDFLLGEFDAKQWLQLPQQAPLQWQDTGTAVYVMDGNAILEFNWNDLDPSLPDAATSILRIYNRSMRRWESLFLPNRSNTPLHFGGVKEGDRIVLHPFAAQTGSNPLFQWIFYDVREAAYRWKGLRSTDRGASWQPQWGIDFVRTGVAITDEDGLMPPSEVTTTSADGVQIFGDLYRASGPMATTVLLFHQAGGDARGEYGDIARRLQAEGFEVMAWDARGGGDRFGETNRTLAALDGPAPEGYCPAYPDLEAALQYAFLEGSGGPIFAVGSSYSAALVIRLAAEHGDLLTGVAAFSPAAGMMDECAVDIWLPRIDGVALLAFRPQSEMEVESVTEQATEFEAQGVELFISMDAAHGASMLNPERSKNVEATWERLLEFFAQAGLAGAP